MEKKVVCKLYFHLVIIFVFSKNIISLNYYTTSLASDDIFNFKVLKAVEILFDKTNAKVNK
jgi:hypothetical protein